MDLDLFLKVIVWTFGALFTFWAYRTVWRLLMWLVGMVLSVWQFFGGVTRSVRRTRARLGRRWHTRVPEDATEAQQAATTGAGLEAHELEPGEAGPAV